MKNAFIDINDNYSRQHSSNFPLWSIIYLMIFIGGEVLILHGCYKGYRDIQERKYVKTDKCVFFLIYGVNVLIICMSLIVLFIFLSLRRELKNCIRNNLLKDVEDSLQMIVLIIMVMSFFSIMILLCNIACFSLIEYDDRRHGGMENRCRKFMEEETIFNECKGEFYRIYQLRKKNINSSYFAICLAGIITIYSCIQYQKEFFNAISMTNN